MGGVILGVIETILDEPALQEPAAAYVAALAKAKLPAGFEKDTKDFLTLLVSKL